ncbi:MAG: prenyltransferase/squalene oxidase repeat-containing protein [Gemmatimonadota bacterium]
MLSTLRRKISALRTYAELPAAGRREAWRDQFGRLKEDPGPRLAIEAGIDWLTVAQDQSRTGDGGVARHWGYRTGWAASYPETTGYIVPTMLEAADFLKKPELEQRGRKMLDWLAAIQLPGGGFQGGTVDATPVVPVTFNTGQIALGLAAGAARFGDPYRGALEQACNCLATTQDPDGCWRRHPTPFARGGEMAYETHVSWGLLEGARVTRDSTWADAARRNIDWALTKQRPNGWFADCCLNDPVRPLTHTIGYVLRGVLEGHRFFGDSALLEASERTADALLGCQLPTGAIPGRLDAEWHPAVSWVCLTGLVQIAACWFYMSEVTGRRQYRDAACRATAFVRRTLHLDGPATTRGGVKGAFPVSGGYGTYEYLNWAAKFLVDACLMEIRASPTPTSIPTPSSKLFG